MTASITGARLPFFKELFDWIIYFLAEKNSQLFASNRANNFVC